jgi:hypothetical protein
MKRMHVHVAVADLEQSIGFYSALFATQPSVVKADYAKWMLDDPRVNFAISTRGKEPGLDHLGIQVESKDELGDVYARLRHAGGALIEQGQTTCCYAKSEKSWIDDPAGISWETFFTTGRARSMATAPESVARASRTKRCAVSRKLPRNPCLNRVRLAARHRTGHGRSVQRSVLVHRQLGALDHGRGHPEQARCR